MEKLNKNEMIQEIIKLEPVFVNAGDLAANQPMGTVLIWTQNWAFCKTYATIKLCRDLPVSFYLKAITISWPEVTTEILFFVRIKTIPISLT